MKYIVKFIKNTHLKRKIVQEYIAYIVVQNKEIL